ncbi:MAG: hypothetical protein Q9160_000460 [Pyrenula sp. 1 TL-2023]
MSAMHSQVRLPTTPPYNTTSSGRSSNSSASRNGTRKPKNDTLNGQQAIKQPPKDKATIKEQLRQAQDRKIREIGEVIKNKEKEKDYTISPDILHKARIVPEHLASEPLDAAANLMYSNGPSNDTDNVTQSWYQDHITTPGSKLSDEWRIGSDDSVDAETASIDSVTPMRHGELPEKKKGGPELGPAGLDGNVLPTVVWHTEPTFHNNSTFFQNLFNSWLQNVCNQTMPAEGSGSHRQQLDCETIFEKDWHPDGLSLVPRDRLVIPNGGEYLYGYDMTDRDQFGHNSRDTGRPTWEDWGKLDPKDDQNKAHGGETAAFLCRNMMGHRAKEKADKLKASQRYSDRARSIRYATEVQENSMVPKTNIYIRPAIRADLDQILSIFNSYVENHARTSELEKIQIIEMQDRLVDCENERLPFLVAILKDFKSTRHTAARTTQAERVVGYGLATDFCLPDRAEKFTAELELYVHREWVRKKIGSCLLDKLIEVCDPGYISRQGYFFHSDDPSRYYPGGNRDLLSLVFVVRYFRNGDEQELEDIKNWLAEFEFKQTGVLERVGVKKGKITNMAYLVRHTAWEPSGN